MRISLLFLKKQKTHPMIFSVLNHQQDIIFKPKGKEYTPQGPGDFILRIRKSIKNFLTFKALTENAGVWVEHETEISNVDETEQMLLKTGFSKTITMTKDRISGKIDDLEICLDNIRELGTFIEIEAISDDELEAKNKIVGLLKKIGHSEKEIIHKGYVAILFEKKGAVFNGNSG